MRKATALLLALLALALASCGGRKQGEERQAVDTIPLMVTKVRQCSRLYTAEYQVRKIVTLDDRKRLEGTFMSQDFSLELPAGRRKVAIPIEATLKAYINFATFGEDNVRRRGNKLEIILPDPKVVLTSSKVDHEGIRQYVALTRSRFTDEELASLERQGRESILRSVTQMGILETARESAARTLAPLLAELGFQERDIKITFRKEFTQADLGTLLDKTSMEHANEYDY